MNGDEREIRDEQPIGPPAQSTQATEDVPSEQQASHAIDDFLSALNGESELGRINFQHFGICSPGAPGLQVSRLVQNVQQNRNGLKSVHATKGKSVFL